LTPYFATKNTTHALFVSIAISIFVCLVFGFLKYYAILKAKRAGLYGALQTLLMGALAAGTSYGIVYGVDRSNIAVLNNFCGGR
jgi:VIT1/CCC1 family predicted Fe2+/Mn2+ transporter